MLQGGQSSPVKLIPDLQEVFNRYFTMLWLQLLKGLPRAELSTCYVPTDSPYPLSVYIREEGGADRARGVYPNHYHFLIEGEDTTHYLELGLRGGNLLSIDVLGIDRGQCDVYDSSYTEVDDPEADASVFSLVPLPQDGQAELSGSAIKQKTKVSLCVYRDAVLYSFDRFTGDRRIPLAPGCDALLSTHRLLAGFVFRASVADEVKAKVLARTAN